MVAYCFLATGGVAIRSYQYLLVAIAYAWLLGFFLCSGPWDRRIQNGLLLTGSSLLPTVVVLTLFSFGVAANGITSGMALGIPAALIHFYCRIHLRKEPEFFTQGSLAVESAADADENKISVTT